MNEHIPIHQLSFDKNCRTSAEKFSVLKIAPRLKPRVYLHYPLRPYPQTRPHRHNYYEILFIEEGQGFHEIDFQTYIIQGAGMHFLMPGQVHLLNLSGPCAGLHRGFFGRILFIL